MTINFLLVDDEEFVTKGLKRLLTIQFSDIGEIFTAPSPIEAIEVLEREDISVVFTDIRMPGMDGLEFMEILARQYPHCKVVVLSGYGSFEYAQKAIANNIKAYLLKPITKEELYDVVAQIITDIKKEWERESHTDRIKQTVFDLLNDERLLTYEMFLQLLHGEDSATQTLTIGATRSLVFDVLGAFLVYAHEQRIEPTLLFVDGNMPTVAISNCTTNEELFSILLSVNEGIIGCNNRMKSQDTADIIETIKTHISQNLDKDSTLELLSDVVYLTPNYISTIFKKATGVSYKDYVLQERIKKAKELLVLNRHKIYEVAQMVGYKSTTHFSKVFKQHVGVYPSDFRG